MEGEGLSPGQAGSEAVAAEAGGSGSEAVAAEAGGSRSPTVRRVQLVPALHSVTSCWVPEIGIYSMGNGEGFKSASFSFAFFLRWT